MLGRVHDHPQRAVAVTINGRAFKAMAGDSVAVTLLAAGEVVQRASPVSGAARGPYCMMGVCFECLVRIDGVGNRQGCLTEVADGMAIETQTARREVGQ